METKAGQPLKPSVMPLNPTRPQQRINKMKNLLESHIDIIGSCDTGYVQLHFNRLGSVKLKVFAAFDDK